MAKDVTTNLGGATVDQGNPLMSSSGPGSAMTVWAQPQVAAQTYRVQLSNGEVVAFATEADYLKAKAFLERQQQAVNAQLSTSSTTQSSGGRGFLRTASDGAETVAAFLQGRNLRRRRDDLLDALDRYQNAKTRLEGLRTAHPDIVPVMLAVLEADRDVTDAALTTIEDTVTAVDIQTGAGVARVAEDLMSDSPQLSFGGSSVAVGAAGLGLGLLLSGDRNSDSRRRRR